MKISKNYIFKNLLGSMKRRNVLKVLSIIGINPFPFLHTADDTLQEAGSERCQPGFVELDHATSFRRLTRPVNSFLPPKEFRPHRTDR